MPGKLDCFAALIAAVFCLLLLADLSYGLGPLARHHNMVVPRQHVLATVKGTINPANWSLKGDYQRLLEANGWTGQQLTHVSIQQDVVYIDQQTSLPLGNRPLTTTRPTVVHSSDEEGNVTSHLTHSCPASAEYTFTAFGKELRLVLKLNDHLDSPMLHVKTVAQTGTQVTVLNNTNDCFYQLQRHDKFGSLAVSGNGYIRASLDTEDQGIVIVPLSIHAPAIDEPGKATPSPDHQFPHLIYTPKTQPDTPARNCGAYATWHDGTQGSHKKHKLRRRHRRRSPREMRHQFKWIELGLIFDSTLLNAIKAVGMEPVEVALHLVNLIDQIYQPLKTKVILAYLELWPENNQIHITRDTGVTLLNLMSYTTENLYAVQYDSLQLVTASLKGFLSDEYGTASTSTVCTLKSVGIVHNGGPNLDIIPLAAKLAHVIAHNLGIHHDGLKDRDCLCPMSDGCIMEGQLAATRYEGRPIFSSCARDYLADALEAGQGQCLLTSPFHEKMVFSKCGNGVVDEGEDCDCGSCVDCMGKGPCCDPVTCLFKEGAECADGPCCTAECKFKKAGSLCRDSEHECDLPEYCTGTNGLCPLDGFKKNGHPCKDDAGYCYNRTCFTQDEQCEEIWGPGSTTAPVECHEYFLEDLPDCQAAPFVRCPTRSDSPCNTVKCQGGNKRSLQGDYATGYSATVTLVTMRGKQFECKSVEHDENSADQRSVPAKNGTKCGSHKVCLAGLCEQLPPLLSRDKCPTNNHAVICSSHGMCDDLNKCSCDEGFTGNDCSQLVHGGPTEKGPEEKAKHTVVLLNSHRSVADNVMENFLMLIIMISLIVLFLVIFLVALFCYRHTTAKQPELVDFYADSDHGVDQTYDLSPPTCHGKPKSHYIPNNLNYSVVPISDPDFSEGVYTGVGNSPESELALIREAKMKCSPCSVHSCLWNTRSIPKCDAAVSPFAPRTPSFRRAFIEPKPGWMSASASRHELPYLSRICSRMALPDSEPVIGRSRVRDFDQLLQQLDSHPVRPFRNESLEPKRVQMRDVNCQVNLDFDIVTDLRENAIPQPMTVVHLPQVITQRKTPDGTGMDSVWQLRTKPALTTSFSTSPQRRRRLSGLRRQERQENRPDAGFSSDSDEGLPVARKPRDFRIGPDFAVM